MASRKFLADVVSGALIAVLWITTGVSTAALVFAGLPGEYFLNGVTILLAATAVCALGGSLLSGFWGTIIGPRSGLAPAYAGMIAAIAASFGVDGNPAAALPTIVGAMMTTTLVTGVVLFLLGRFQLGGLVRYIPYPVMGGFFAGIGFIFMRGAVAVSTGSPVTLHTLASHLTPHNLMFSAPALLFGLVTYLLQRRTGHWIVVLAMIAVSIAAFYAVSYATGVTMGQAAEAGWLPNVSNTTSAWPVLGLDAVPKIHFGLILRETGSILTVAVLSAIILLLECSGIEIVGDCEVDPNRELKVAGATNVVNGLLGGFAGVHSSSESALAVKLGASTRLVGVVYAGVIVVTLTFGTGFISAIPTFVQGGLLAFLGIGFLVEWVWNTPRDLPLADYLVIWVILLFIAAVGLLQGVAFGFAVAIVLFVISYSRLGTIKAEMNGADHMSHVVRSAENRELLDREGRRIRILKLQGFIFFGTAESLLDSLRQRLGGKADTEADEKIDYFVLDFQHVSRLDSSAVQAFSKLKRLTGRERVGVILTDLRPSDHQRLERIHFFTDDSDGDDQPLRLSLPRLDDGVAWCEADILRAFSPSGGIKVNTLEDHLAEVTGNAEAAQRLAAYFETMDVAAGQYLFHEGDPGDSLYLLSSGVASVVMSANNSDERAIRIFEKGTLLGEMAIYTRESRSASVRIDEESRLHKLTLERFEQMQTAEPHAAGLFHASVVKLLAERLARANRELQRLS